MKYWRTHRIRGWREYAAFLALMFTTFVCGTMMMGFTIMHASPPQIGITYSSKYAQSLGLDPQSAFTEIVDDLGVKNVRLPVYWSDVESVQGAYDYTQLDTMLEAATQRDLSVTLVVGMKVPRWPECFIPEFYSREPEQLDPAVLRYLQDLVMHARQYDVITRWQVENEPLFPYGDCPEASMERLRQEVALVRALDERPILMTVSGEQEPWLDLASLGDVIGASIYRFAYQKTIGAISFPHTPTYYRLHAFVTRFFADDVIVSELQMEPWFTGNPQDPASLDVPFSAEDFTTHLQFVKDTGLPEALLWGAEWWYYQHLRGDDALWNAAIDAFAQDSLE